MKVHNVILTHGLDPNHGHEPCYWAHSQYLHGLEYDAYFFLGLRQYTRAQVLVPSKHHLG